MKKIISIYSIFIGVSIIGMWLLLLSDNHVIEGKTAISFHLFSEFMAASLCIVGGVPMILGNGKAVPVNIAGLSMVIYSVLNAAGYYGEKNNFPLMIFFSFLFFTSCIALGFTIKMFLK